MVNRFKGLALVALVFGLIACEKRDSSGKTDTTGDPLYSYQWHLHNTGQAGRTGYAASPGEDLNVKALWDSCPASGCRGEGVLVVVVDDGVEIAHEDLSANIASGKSYDFAIPGAGDPTPTLDEDAHGTMVAGIIAARDDNGKGVRGIASRARLAGYNLLSEGGTDANEATAMTHNRVGVSVSNNSWGPADGTGFLYESTGLWQEAIDLGLTQGRDGNGTIYVWAGGNGYYESFVGYADDDSNFDGYANFPGVIAAAALNAYGKRASYSEPGANILISGFGGEFCETDGLLIATTDRSSSKGHNDGSSSYDLTNRSYTRCMNGTSSAAPTVAGVVALVLQANPALTWRDVRQVLAKSARKNDPLDGNWTTNGAGLEFNRQYGFGAADAYAAVNLAKSWTNLPAMSSQSFIDGTGYTLTHSTISSYTYPIASTIDTIEFIQLRLAFGHAFDIGELEIWLMSPEGTLTMISPTHACHNPYTGADSLCEQEATWTFSTSHFMDEEASGDWNLTFVNVNDTLDGNFTDFNLTIFGH